MQRWRGYEYYILEYNLYFCTQNFIGLFMKTKHFYFLFLMLLLLVSCNSSQPQKTIADISKTVTYPVGYIPKFIGTDLNDASELFPLQEEFLNHFMQMHAQYDGAHPVVATEFPENWGVMLVERLSEGRELYQIQSLNREWIFLVITSGYGSQRILDILPVAIDLAIQTPDILETEIWTTERGVDDAFSITKKYEWKRSIENVSHKEYEANPHNYFRTKTVTDKYFINNLCRFERIVTENLPEYFAVVFYYKDEKPEEWDEVAPMLEAFCEDYSILFVEVHSHFDKVMLYDYKLNYITDLDITPYIDLPEGVIFMKKGEIPKAVPFGSYERIKSEIKRYYKIVEV